MKLTDKLRKMEEAKKPTEPTYHFSPIQNNNTTCCGLLEAYNFCVQDYVKPATIKQIRQDFKELFTTKKKGAMFATVVQMPEFMPEKVEEVLQLCGWEPGITFNNPNTGRDIKIWMLSRKDLETTIAAERA